MAQTAYDQTFHAHAERPVASSNYSGPILSWSTPGTAPPRRPRPLPRSSACNRAARSSDRTCHACASSSSACILTAQPQPWPARPATVFLQHFCVSRVLLSLRARPRGSGQFADGIRTAAATPSCSCRTARRRQLAPERSFAAGRRDPVLCPGTGGWSAAVLAPPLCARSPSPRPLARGSAQDKLLGCEWGHGLFLRRRAVLRPRGLRRRPPRRPESISRSRAYRGLRQAETEEAASGWPTTRPTPGTTRSRMAARGFTGFRLRGAAPLKITP